VKLKIGDKVSTTVGSKHKPMHVDNIFKEAEGYVLRLDWGGKQQHTDLVSEADVTALRVGGKWRRVTISQGEITLESGESADTCKQDREALCTLCGVCYEGHDICLKDKIVPCTACGICSEGE
jgi:hypothetical protein